jgi:hypothetical protein
MALQHTLRGYFEVVAECPVDAQLLDDREGLFGRHEGRGTVQVLLRVLAGVEDQHPEDLVGSGVPAFGDEQTHEPEPVRLV